MATRMGFEPTISGVTGQYVNRYTTGPDVAGLVASVTLVYPLPDSLSSGAAGDWGNSGEIARNGGAAGIAGATAAAFGGLQSGV